MTDTNPCSPTPTPTPTPAGVTDPSHGCQPVVVPSTSPSPGRGDRDRHSPSPSAPTPTPALSSNRGSKTRNEDALAIHLAADSLATSKGTVAVIADGVSAASFGAEASHTAAHAFISDYLSTPATWQIKTAAHRVLTSLNRWLYSQGQSLREAEQGHLTTFTAVIIKSRTAHLFHIGDSRLYLLRAGSLEQITRDHCNRNASGDCHLTRALGLNLNAKFDYHPLPLEPGDTLLLTTDGIHDFIPHKELERTLNKSQNPTEAAAALDALALANASTDDRSLLILPLPSLPEESKADAHRRISALPIPPDLDPGMILDGLRIEKLLCASARSQLYLVRDEETGRRLVMKTPSPNFSDDPAYLDRFALEEWIGLRTQNPHLVKALARPAKSCLYLLVEYIDGLSLATWSTRNPTPGVKEVIRFTKQIIEGVRALHRAETLHQDLKPDNIILDGNGCLRLIDYGSCRIAAVAETHAAIPREEALGTLDFSAPEYRLGLSPDTRADQFSLAVITYHLLTGGAHPFPKGWERAKTLHHFLNLTYRPASAINPHVPAWIDTTLKKALSVRPENRYDSLSEFLHDLNHPNPSFNTGAPSLPLAERNPLLLWKLISLALLLALIVALLLD